VDPPAADKILPYALWGMTAPQQLHRPAWRKVNGSLDRWSPESSFPLDSNSKPHLLEVSAARTGVSIGRGLHFVTSRRS
jgi:hypothetical protein